MTKHQDEKKEETSGEKESQKEKETKVEKTEDPAVLAEKYLDNWKRAVADFENYKKRQAESQKDIFQFANEGMIIQLLPVLDNFHASTDHIPEAQKNDAWVVGIMHIQKQLEKVLEDNGVSAIEAKAGDSFDPALHEAISSEQKKGLKNKIAKVILKGYRIGEKVIRAVRVTVE